MDLETKIAKRERMRRNLQKSILLAQLNMAKFVRGMDGKMRTDTLFAGISAEHNLLTALHIVHNAIMNGFKEDDEIDIDAYNSSIGVPNLSIQELVTQIRKKENTKITFAHNIYKDCIIHFEGEEIHSIDKISRWAVERGFWVNLKSYTKQNGQVVIDVIIDNPGGTGIELNKIYEVHNPYF